MVFVLEIKVILNRLYIGEEQTIYNGMIFKANQTLFQVRVKDIVDKNLGIYYLNL